MWIASCKRISNIICAKIIIKMVTLYAIDVETFWNLFRELVLDFIHETSFISSVLQSKNTTHPIDIFHPRIWKLEIPCVQTIFSMSSLLLWWTINNQHSCLELVVYDARWTLKDNALGCTNVYQFSRNSEKHCNFQGLWSPLVYVWISYWSTKDAQLLCFTVNLLFQGSFSGMFWNEFL